MGIYDESLSDKIRAKLRVPTIQAKIAKSNIASDISNRIAEIKQQREEKKQIKFQEKAAYQEAYNKAKIENLLEKAKVKAKEDVFKKSLIQKTVDYGLKYNKFVSKRPEYKGNYRQKSYSQSPKPYQSPQPIPLGSQLSFGSFSEPTPTKSKYPNPLRII